MVKFALLNSAAGRAFISVDGGYLPTPQDVAFVREHQRSAGRPTNNDAMLVRDPDIAAMVDYWDKTTSIIDGIEAMRLGGTEFLPRFVLEDNTEYNFRLSLTKMTNVYRDIIESLSAKPFEREVCIKNDDAVPAIDEFEDDVDGAGSSLSVFANTVFFNGINSAIDWIYIDFPVRDPNVVTLEQYRAAGYRPYWSRVLGSNMLKVRSKMVNSVETLFFVRVFEPGDVNHIREFERSDDGMVTCTVYRDSGEMNEKTKTAYVVESVVTLSINKIPLVPFITGRRDGRTWRIFPAMQDAADLQIDLYQQESGLKFAKTLTAYPMLSASGVSPEKDQSGNAKPVRVGPNRILYAPPTGDGKFGKWEYIEPSSESLKFLAADIEGTIKELRELGRQPLTTSSQNLTKETTQVAAGKAKSAIKQWAIGLQNSLEKALQITVDYMGIEFDPSVDVYTEFDEFYDDKSLTSLRADRDKGDLSRQTYWSEMKRRGVYSPEFDPIEEEKLLLGEVPSDGLDTTED